MAASAESRSECSSGASHHDRQQAPSKCRDHLLFVALSTSIIGIVKTIFGSRRRLKWRIGRFVSTCQFLPWSLSTHGWCTAHSKMEQLSKGSVYRRSFTPSSRRNLSTIATTIGEEERDDQGHLQMRHPTKRHASRPWKVDVHALESSPSWLQWRDWRKPMEKRHHSSTKADVKSVKRRKLGNVVTAMITIKRCTFAQPKTVLPRAYCSQPCTLRWLLSNVLTFQSSFNSSIIIVLTVIVDPFCSGLEYFLYRNTQFGKNDGVN